MTYVCHTHEVERVISKRESVETKNSFSELYESEWGLCHIQIRDGPSNFSEEFSRLAMPLIQLPQWSYIETFDMNVR